MDRLIVEIERKEHEISEKDRALGELEEQLKQAQQHDEHNVSLINLLHESRYGLAEHLKHGQDELQAIKDDKQTYKET